MTFVRILLWCGALPRLSDDFPYPYLQYYYNCDDSFATPSHSPGLSRSAYGDYCLNTKTGSVRGRVLLCKLRITRIPGQTKIETPHDIDVVMLGSPVECPYEFMFMPISCAEVALLILSRMQAARVPSSIKVYTWRTWRARVLRLTADAAFEATVADHPNANVCVSKLDMASVCSYCQKRVNKTQLCGGCRLAQYCSQVCQKADWPTHKPECKKASITP